MSSYYMERVRMFRAWEIPCCRILIIVFGFVLAAFFNGGLYMATPMSAANGIYLINRITGAVYICAGGPPASGVVCRAVAKVP